jgi:hypothetical protein
MCLCVHSNPVYWKSQWPCIAIHQPGDLLQFYQRPPAEGDYHKSPSNVGPRTLTLLMVLELALQPWQLIYFSKATNFLNDSNGV